VHSADGRDNEGATVGADREPDYPSHLPEAGHVEPAPRRVRGRLQGVEIFDTTSAVYVWEQRFYPQYYVPMIDVNGRALVPTGLAETDGQGTAELYELKARGATRPRAAKHYTSSDLPAIADTVRFDWDAIDEWLEEDERIFVHPRSPYVRVDAVRSRRHIRIRLKGVLLADSQAPVMLYETGLPTRYYVERTALCFANLLPTSTVTECPYKGATSEYWSAVVNGGTHPDIAWSYGFPNYQLSAIAGLVAFYNERVDIELDGVDLARPKRR